MPGTKTGARKRWGGDAELRGRFWDKGIKGDGCWLWTGTRSCNGHYGLFRMQGPMIYAHRASWIMTNGPIVDGLQVLHRCDNTGRVRPDHLFLGTRKDNMQDKERKGRGNHRRGAGVNTVKLTEDQVRGVRFLHAAGVTKTKLAKMHDVTFTAGNSIVSGASWAWL